MQWLTLVPEDSGIQRLKSYNRRPAVARAVDALSPCPPTHAGVGGEGKGAARRQSDQRNRRRNDRRRGGDRRQRRLAVLLDTRNRNDRRAIENRRRPTPGVEQLPAGYTCIDLYA